MSERALDGRTVLVVGASAGVGRAVAVSAVRAGAGVVLAARRADRLAEVVAEAGGGTAVAADVRDQSACGRLVDDAVSTVGSLDAVVYAAGRAPLRTMIETAGDEWAETFATNVFGVNHVVGAALPHLRAGGLVAVLSSETVGRPRYALGAYSASKAALDESLRAWRHEHPTTRFCCVAIGATQPTDFGVSFDREVLGPAYEHWVRHGFMQQEFMDTWEVAEFLVDLVALALRFPKLSVENLLLRSPSPLLGSASVE